MYEISLENFADGSLAKLPYPSVFVRQRVQNCRPILVKINRGQDTYYISVCTKSAISI